PAGKYSLACACRYYCSIERLRQHSQKSTLGDRSALCSAMAGVSSLMATKSSGGYLEGWRLESKAHSAASPRANFRLWAQAVPTAAQQAPALHRCAILSVGGADRAHLDSGPPRRRRGDPMKRREFIRPVGGAALVPFCSAAPTPDLRPRSRGGGTGDHSHARIPGQRTTVRPSVSLPLAAAPGRAI